MYIVPRKKRANVVVVEMETWCNRDICAILKGKEALASSGSRSISPVYIKET